MPIVCLEGPSTVGKSSTARWLAAEHGAVTIPEVNLLFARPSAPEPFWYYQRQVERWHMALTHPAEQLVILDGDPFQPLWYNLLFPEVEARPYQETLAFYGQELATGRLAWPDAYVVLQAEVAALRQRKMGDPNFRRGNFEKHLALVDFLPRYFGRLAELAPNMVNLQQAETVASNGEAVLLAAENEPTKTDHLAIFSGLAAWLEASHPKGKGPQ